MGGELETGTDCYILIPSSFDHSSTSFAFWLSCSTVGHWGLKAICLPLALNSASCPQLTPTATGTDSNWLKLSVAPGYIIVLRTPASCGRTHLPPNSTASTGQGDILISSTGCTCFVVLMLFTQVHLLIDGSVEGQYVTFMHYLPDKKIRCFYLPGCRVGWLAGVVVNHGLVRNKKIREFFLYKNHQSEAAVPFSSPLDSSNSFRILYTNLRFGNFCIVVNITQYCKPFEHFLRSWLCQGVVFFFHWQCPIDFSWPHIRQNLKQAKCDNLPITPTFYQSIYFSSLYLC